MTYENRFCPNCGSENVEPDTRHTNVLGEMIFNPDKWYCKECDYAGLMPTEGENNDELEFEPTENKTVDTDAGRGYTKFILVVLIVGLIYGIFLILF